MWIDVVAALAALQLLFFGVQVGSARTRFGVKAPATTGHEQFERYYRVQMNTIELLAPLLAGLYLASHYWSPAWVAAAGAVYLVGRMVYRSAYLRDPASRTVGFALSVAPVFCLLLAALVGAVLQWLR